MFWMCLEPGNFPAWAFRLTYFRPWRDQGVWERINPYLRAWMRLQRNRSSSPSAAIVDTQSVTISGLTKIACGFDRG